MADLPDLSGVIPPPTRWQWAGPAFMRSTVRSRFDYHGHGEDNLPRSGPVILASNHMGYLDGPPMPANGARLDTVFGAPVFFEAVPWPRTKRQVAAVQAEIQHTLAAHVQAACELTGQSLPAMPTIR